MRILSGRVRLPRLLLQGRLGFIYWPPSRRSLQKLKELIDQYGDDPNIEIENPFHIEGADIEAIWEPVWEGYPALEEFWPEELDR